MMEKVLCARRRRTWKTRRMWKTRGRWKTRATSKRERRRMMILIQKSGRMESTRLIIIS